MKKIFNFRPIFLAFVGIFIGAYFSVNILFSSLFLKIILALILLILICCSFIKIQFFLKRKVPILVLCFCLIFGFGYNCLKINSYNKNQVDDNLQISGTVSDKILTKNGYSTVILKDVYSNTNNLKGDLKLTIYGDIVNVFGCGDKLSFSTNVKSYPIIENDNIVNAKLEKTDCKYFAGVDVSKISVKEGRPSFFEKIRMNSRNSILNNTSSEEIGNLIYSVVFGDKTFLSNDIYNSFSLSGTAHLLAVSGLHVGFVVALILLLLNLFKIKKWIKVLIVAFLLVAYNLLCGFCASVVRASLMTVLLLLSNLFGERNDALTSLGLAGILILIFKPLQVFDVGFQLSFGSVLGIICLAKPLQKMFIKAKLPKVLAGSFAVCVSANVGTLPFMALSFKSFAFIGLVSNIIIIPIFGLVYCFTFFVFLLSSALPFLSFLFIPCEIGFLIILKIAKVFALVGGIRLVKFGIVVLLIYPFILLVSDFSFIKKNIKQFMTVALIATISLTSALNLVPAQTVFASVSKLEENATILTTSSNEVLLISETFDDFEIYDAQNYLVEKNFSKILSAIVITGTAKDMKEVYKFAEQNEKIKIFITSNCFIDVREINKYNNLIILDRITFCGSFELIPLEYNNRICAVQISSPDISVLSVNLLSNSEIFFLNDAEINVDVIVCNKFSSRYNDLEIKYKKFVASQSSNEVKISLHLTNKNEIYTIKKIQGVLY